MVGKQIQKALEKDTITFTHVRDKLLPLAKFYEKKGEMDLAEELMARLVEDEPENLIPSRPSTLLPILDEPELPICPLTNNAPATVMDPENRALPSARR